MSESNRKPDPWRKRFYRNAADSLGSQVLTKHFPDVEQDSDPEKAYSEEEIASWTRKNINTLKEVGSSDQCKDILTGCTCHIMADTINKVRKVYVETGSIDQAHNFMAEDFYLWLKLRPGLTPESYEFMKNKNWGVAGKKNGNKVIATKIPADTAAYFRAEEADQKRYHYCHCPRVKPVLKSKGNTPPVEYCYCGAGFYRAIWEGILGKPIDISILQSLLMGDEMCQFEIVLPKDL